MGKRYSCLASKDHSGEVDEDITAKTDGDRNSLSATKQEMRKPYSGVCSECKSKAHEKHVRSQTQQNQPREMSPSTQDKAKGVPENEKINSQKDIGSSPSSVPVATCNIQSHTTSTNNLHDVKSNHREEPSSRRNKLSDTKTDKSTNEKLFQTTESERVMDTYYQNVKEVSASKTSEANSKKEVAILQETNSLSEISHHNTTIEKLQKRLGLKECAYERLQRNTDKTIQELREKVKSAQKELSVLALQVADVTAEKKTSEGRGEHLQKELHAALKEKVMALEALKKEQKEFGNRRNEQTEYQKEVGQQRKDMTSQASNLKTEISEMSTNNKRLQTDIDRMQEDIRLKDNELRSLRNDKDKLEKDLVIIQNERTALSEQAITLKEETEGSMSKMEVFQQEMELLREELEQRDASLRSVRLERDTLLTKIKTLHQEHQAAQREMTTLVSNLREENSELTSKVEASFQEIENLKLKLSVQAELRQTTNKLARQLDKMHNDRDDIQKDVSKLLAKFDEDNCEVASTMDVLKTELLKLEDVLNVKRDLMISQWREEPIFDKQYLKILLHDVESYWPLKDMGVSEHALRHVNIMLIGPVGVGKSSFINSVDSVFRGHVTLSAATGNREKSLTAMYRQYPVIASDNKRYLRLQLCDCRGLEEGFKLTKDIDVILDGHMPNDYIFSSFSSLTTKMHGYNGDPDLRDKIHCVVYVLDAAKYSPNLGMSFVTTGVKEQITHIQENASQRGIPQLILLNKVDTVCASTRADTSAMYSSALIRDRCVHAANCLGLPPMTVLPMRNHDMDLSLDDDVSILALYNLRQMLKTADSYLRTNFMEELRADR